MLALAEEIPRPPQLQVRVRNGEAVRGAFKKPQPFQSLWAAVDENAGGLVSAPANAPPQLVQLGEAVALRVLNDHNSRVRYVHPHLHHSGGHQQPGPALGEVLHGPVLLGGLHLAVKHLQGDSGKGLADQGLILVQAHHAGLPFGNQRAD